MADDRLLVALMPDEPEVWGLLALMLLTDARRTARTTADGALVLLRDQDRNRWDEGKVTEGLELVRRCLRLGRPGPCQVQAAITAVRCAARTAEETDWAQVVALDRAAIARTGSSPARAFLETRLRSLGEPAQASRSSAMLLPPSTAITWPVT